MDKLSGSVTVNGTQLRYVAEGNGKPCVVIGSSIMYPRAFSQELREYFRFIFVDMRWFAPTSMSADVGKVTLDTILDDIELVRSTLELGPVVVLGHSITALVALEYARKYPQNSSHVVMINIYPYRTSKAQEITDEFWESQSSDERKTLLVQNREKLTEDVLSSLSPAEATVMRYVASGPMYWYDPTYDCSWLWKGAEFNRDVGAHLLGVIFKEYDNTECFSQITTPVFLSLGRHDYAVPYVLWDDQKGRLPNLSYNLFEKSGHWPMLEEQKLFDRKLIEWISSH